MAVIATLLVPVAWSGLSRLQLRAARQEAARDHMRRAAEAVEAGAFERAERAFQAAAALTPRDPVLQAAMRRAAVRRAAEKPETIGQGELAALDYAARVEGDTAPAHTTLGHVAFRQERADQAMEEYEAALARDPSFVPALVGKARVYRARGDRLAALQGFEAAVKAGPQDLAALNDLGVQYLDMERPKDAVTALQRALEVRDNPATRLNLAAALEKLDRRAEAIEHLERAAAMAPGSKAVLSALGGLREKAEEFDEAARVYERLLAQGREASTVIALARVRLRQHRAQDAKDLLTGVLARDPQNVLALFWYGNVQYTLGDHKAAAQTWQTFTHYAAGRPEYAALVKEARAVVAKMKAADRATRGGAGDSARGGAAGEPRAPTSPGGR